ncbi:MAG TPA: hypothetical protein VHU18_10285 [Rhizomicrobium sp.]|jgi:hypothetical protein|nr:hypothetical protein [Rhizomicrobium sp.]
MTVTKIGALLSLRQWIELLLGAAALIVSGVSLWVAIGTEQANRQMVAASSWPLLLADTSDVPENGRGMITFSLINGGVGPAKLKTFEVWWHGKPYSGAASFLEACCGYQPFTGPADLSTVGRTPVITGGVRNTVVLAGEKRTFLRMALGRDNVAVWRKLDRARRELQFRGCYCSVFEECWIGTLMNLEPRKVDRCPAVRVPYVE